MGDWSRRDRWLLGAGVLAALLGIAFVLLRSIFRPVPEIDFRFFWLAGKLWDDGIDPYGPGFERIGMAVLPSGNRVQYWFYPPQWWALCRMLAASPLDSAITQWRLASGTMIFVGTSLLVWPIAGGTRGQRTGYTGLAIGFALLIEPTANVLAFGQSAAPLYLAFCLFAFGVERGAAWAVAAGIALATFKPQVGALLVVAALIVPRLRIATVVGLGAAALLAMPQIARFGIARTIHEYLANMHEWSTIGSNTMLTSSGPLHLLARIVPLAINPQLQLLLAIPATIIAAFLLRRSEATPSRALFLLFAAMIALIPLHIYDMTLLVIPLVYAIALVGAPRPAILFAALLAVRPGKIETLLHVPTYGSGVSAGLIGLSIAALILLALAIRETFGPRDTIGRDLLRFQSGPAGASIPIRSRTT